MDKNISIKSTYATLNAAEIKPIYATLNAACIDGVICIENKNI